MSPPAPSELKGISRVGGVIIRPVPGMPEFTEALGDGTSLGILLSALPPADRRGLGALLSAFSRLPRFVVIWLLWTVDRHRCFPGPLGAALRLVHLGVKGAVYSVYYSHPGVCAGIGWDAKVNRKVAR